MFISGLIDQLKRIQKDYGDINVQVRVWNSNRKEYELYPVVYVRAGYEHKVGQEPSATHNYRAELRL